MTPRAGFFARPFAHRGLHGPGRPENSQAAIAAACAGGWGIEIDVQASADGVAMVFHDDHLTRLTGQSGAIRQRTVADLSRLRLLGGDDAGIPTLAEVLRLVAGRVPLVVEVKDQDGALGENVGALEAAVARDLAAYAGPVAVMSFNPHSVAAMRRLAPDLPRGLVTCAYDAKDWPQVPAARRAALARLDLEGLEASFISHDIASLDMPQVANLQAQGLPILCWTVRSATQEAAARRYADQITFEGYTPA